MNRSHVSRRVLIAVVLALTCAFSQLLASESDETRTFQEAKLLWKKGYYMHTIGKYEKAISLFSRSLELHPTAEAYTFRGWSFSMLGRIEDAIAECKRAIEVDPEYGNPYNDIGAYLIELGQPENAIPWLKKATEAKRYCCYQYPHFNLGRVLLMQGRVSEAKKSLIRSLTYDPAYLPPQILLEYIQEKGLEPLPSLPEKTESDLQTAKPAAPPSPGRA